MLLRFKWTLAWTLAVKASSHSINSPRLCSYPTILHPTTHHRTPAPSAPLPPGVSVQELLTTVGRISFWSKTQAGWRCREQRLSSWAKHERQTVTMSLSAALHHSADKLHTKDVVEKQQYLLRNRGPREIWRSTPLNRLLELGEGHAEAINDRLPFCCVVFSCELRKALDGTMSIERFLCVALGCWSLHVSSRRRTKYVAQCRDERLQVAIIRSWESSWDAHRHEKGQVDVWLKPSSLHFLLHAAPASVRVI